MPRFPISEWQAEQLRFTAFPQPWGTDREHTWWEQIVGTPPEEFSSNPKKGTSQITGLYAQNGLVLNLDPTRIDWLYTPIQPDDAQLSSMPPIPTIGDLHSSLSTFKHLMGKWLTLESVPPINRLAFGGIIFHPESSRDEGYHRITDFLPIQINPASTSDFHYQINHPIEFSSDLIINRLSKWSIAAFKRTLLTIGSHQSTQSTQSTDPVFAFRMEFDINTSHEFSGEITRPNFEPVFMRLIEHALLIAEHGTVSL